MKKLIFPLFLLLSLFSAPDALAADVIVDFNQIIGQNSQKATGFEWINSSPATTYLFLSQLKPDVIKDPGAFYQAYKNLGVTRIQILLGNQFINQGQSPWLDGNAWKNFISNKIIQNTTKSEKIEWIIFQEPTLPAYWPGTREQFFEAWKIAHQTIKTLRPDDLIIGPSPHQFDQLFLQDFLIYAKANNVLPDILSWHELSAIGSQSYSADLIPQRVNAIKQFMRSSGINISRISLTEYQGKADNYKPGVTAAFIINIEKAGIEGTKGNWNINGDAQRLSGLVTNPSNPQPRSIWWVYKAYADMKGTLVKSNMYSNINGIGSFETGKNSARILLSNQGGSAIDRTLQVNNIPQFLLKDNKLSVSVEKIQNSELSASTPALASHYLVSPINNSLNISLPGFGTWDAYYITLHKPPITGITQSGTALTVNFLNPDATNSDWIGIYPSGSNSFTNWKWLDNSKTSSPPTQAKTSSGSVTFENVALGNYEIRYHSRGLSQSHFIKLDSQIFTLTISPTSTISPTPTVSMTPVPTYTPSPTPTTSITLTPNPAPKPGDANDDGFVDGVDYVIWLNNFNKEVSSPKNGDFDSNDFVDGIDYVIWLSNFDK